MLDQHFGFRNNNTNNGGVTFELNNLGFKHDNSHLMFTLL